MKSLLNLYAKFLWVIPAAIIAYDLYYFREALNLKFLIWAIIPFGLAYLLWKFPVLHQKYWMPSFALIGASLVYTFYPDIFVDDTGFVIRYLRNAADGCFYCFNPSEGPAFGMSGFIYGVVTSFIALFGVVDPVMIIKGVNFLGLFWMILMLTKIVHRYSGNVLLTIAGTSFIVLSASKFLLSSTAGLETNFHLAIVFTALYAYVYDKRKLFWLFLSLAAISKLDTVPFAVVLGIAHIIEGRKSYLGKTAWQFWKTLLIYCGVPLVLYLIITYFMFGGPLPQSAAAKLTVHGHPDGHWFPFLQTISDKSEGRAFIKIGLGLVVLHFLLALFRKEFNLKDFAVFGTLIGTMALYYVYNPAERMIWYYAMPELLFFLQTAISTFYLMRGGKIWHVSGSLLVFAGIYLASLTQTLGERNWMKQYMERVELERIELGELIGEITTENDTLAAGHGHFGAYSDAFVLDMSGLNSKLAIEDGMNLEMYSVVEKYQPTYFVHHGDDNLIYVANTFDYKLVEARFGINQYTYPTWLLFKKNLSDSSYFYERYYKSEQNAGGMGTDKLMNWEGSEKVIDLNSETEILAIYFGLHNVMDSEQTVFVSCGSLSREIRLKPDEVINVEIPVREMEVQLSIRAESIRMYDLILEKSEN